jgi:hypothetical protein
MNETNKHSKVEHSSVPEGVTIYDHGSFYTDDGPITEEEKEFWAAFKRLV